MRRNFEGEIETLRNQLEGVERWKVVYGLRATEEDWARQLLGIAEKGALATLVRKRVERGIDARTASEAEAHLARAEDWQWEIGSWATGAGEGLASMGAVYELKMARAWLDVALSKAKDEGKSRAEAALALVAEIARDPNGMGKGYEKSIAELSAILKRNRPRVP